MLKKSKFAFPAKKSTKMFAEISGEFIETRLEYQTTRLTVWHNKELNLSFWFQHLLCPAKVFEGVK